MREEKKGNEQRERKMVSGMNVGLMPSEWYNGRGLCLWDLFEEILSPSPLTFNEGYLFYFQCAWTGCSRWTCISHFIRSLFHFSIVSCQFHCPQRSVTQRFFSNLFLSFLIVIIPAPKNFQRQPEKESPGGAASLCCVRGRGEMVQVKEMGWNGEREPSTEEGWKTWNERERERESNGDQCVNWERSGRTETREMGWDGWMKGRKLKRERREQKESSLKEKTWNLYKESRLQFILQTALNLYNRIKSEVLFPFLSLILHQATHSFLYNSQLTFLLYTPFKSKRRDCSNLTFLDCLSYDLISLPSSSEERWRKKIFEVKVMSFSSWWKSVYFSMRKRKIWNDMNCTKVMLKQDENRTSLVSNKTILSILSFQKSFLLPFSTSNLSLQTTKWLESKTDGNDMKSIYFTPQHAFLPLPPLSL